MKNGIRVYLDDKRTTPDGFDLRVYTAPAAIAALETGTVEHISLDHDLGLLPEEGCGYDVAVWIEEAAYLNKIPRLTWAIHSANPVGRKRMEAALVNADRYWKGA